MGVFAFTKYFHGVIWGTLVTGFLLGAPCLDFWDEFRYWEAVFSSPVVPFGGVTRSFSRFHSLPLQLLAFDRHVYTDASTSFGWGLVLSGHVIFGPWRDLSAMGLKFGRYLFQAPTILLMLLAGVFLPTTSLSRIGLLFAYS
jgi:hypothetical protein